MPQVHNYFFDVLVVGYATEDGSNASGGSGPLGGGGGEVAGGVAGGSYLRLVRRVDATEEMVAEGELRMP